MPSSRPSVMRSNMQKELFCKMLKSTKVTTFTRMLFTGLRENKNKIYLHVGETTRNTVFHSQSDCSVHGVVVYQSNHTHHRGGFPEMSRSKKPHSQLHNREIAEKHLNPSKNRQQAGEKAVKSSETAWPVVSMGDWTAGERLKTMTPYIPSRDRSTGLEEKHAFRPKNLSISIIPAPLPVGSKNRDSKKWYVITSVCHNHKPHTLAYNIKKNRGRPP